MLYINPDTCIDCDACVSACPVEAIYRDQNLPENLSKFLRINAQGAKEYSKNIIVEQKAPLPTVRARLLEIEATQGPMPEARKILDSLLM